MQLSGAEILIQCLAEQGVDTVFGYPGGAVLDIYDALYRDGRINHILTAHEQGAAHAADGYARVTGKVGVCFATSGPGATNLVTGIATAYMDSVPLVAITGNVGLSMLGRDSFQEIDICGITMPITKHNYIIKDVSELADAIREAFLIASSGRKGPVLIDILKNVQTQKTEYVPATPEVYKPKATPELQAKKLAEILNGSERPFILAGGGVIGSGAERELLSLAEKLGAPVSCTMMGLGSIPASNPLFLGLIGMHGTHASARACLDCDVIIAVGTRFSDRVALNRDKFASGRKVVQIEIDGAELFSPLVVSYSLPEQAAVTATEAPPSDVLAARTGTTVASTYLVQSALIQNLGGDGLTFVTVKDYLADTMSRSGSVNLPLIDVAEAEHPPEGQDGKTEGVAELTMGRNLVVFEGGSFVIEEELAQVTTMLVRNKVLGRLSVQTPAGDRFEFRVLNASPSVEAEGMSVHAALDVTVSFMEAQGASAKGKLSPSSEAVRAAADDAADMLKERILACHRLSLETGADFLHLEEAVYRKEGYPLPKGCLDDIAFDCSVTVKVKEAG